jgi:AmpD protein
VPTATPAPSLRLDPETGLLEGARFIASPHCDERPAGTEIELLVIHGISLPPGEFGGGWIEQLFTGRLRFDAHPYFQQLRELKVSAHFLIRRDGGLQQFVSTQQRAWHAGISSFRGREACNDFSVGVELEGADEVPYAAPQYLQLIALSQALMQAYPAIKAERILGHSDIAPGRKTDPGPAFDWARFRTALASAAPGGLTRRP